MDCWETGWPSESTLNLPFFTDPPPPLQELKIGENKTEMVYTLWTTPLNISNQITVSPQWS